LLLLMAGFGFGLSTVALKYLSPSSFRTAYPTPNREEQARPDQLMQAAEDALRPAADRPVYPYSIVPGGVNDARELKWVAEHDPVVAAHYAGFDYDHARVVQLVLARTVYLSYRIGNQVYWTRHRVTLKKGEKLLTDGKITGRTRCANRVEEVPQQATSSSEPPAAKFEEPVRPGTAVENPPVQFQSALSTRPGVGMGPLPPLSIYTPIQGGGWVPIAPPPLPVGVCGPVKKKQPSGELTKRKSPGPCSPGSGGGGTVPEPGTWLLVASGLGAMYWQLRRRSSQA
jgi:PEP-CTERM motif